MRAICLALVVGTSLGAQTPAPATGRLAVDKTEITLHLATAVSYAGGTGRFVSVLLSDKVADGNTFAEYTRIGAGERFVPGTFEGAWAGMHMENGFSGFTFSIDTSNKLLTNQLLVGGRNMFSLSADDLVLEVTSVSPRLIGRIRTKPALLDLGEHKVSVDATFDIAVMEAGKESP